MLTMGKQGFTYLAVLALASLAAYVVGLAPPPSTPTKIKPTEINIGPLVVKAQDLRVGEIWENDAWQLLIENRSERDIRIDGFHVFCGCLTIEPPSLEIPKRQTRHVRIKLRPSPIQNSKDYSAFQSFSYRVRPYGKTLTQEVSRSEWTVEGVIRRRVTFDTTFVHFGKAHSPSDRPPIRRVIATVHVPFRQIHLDFDADILTATAKQLPVANRFELEISPRPSLHPGSFGTDLGLHLEAEDGETVLGGLLRVEGELRSDVYLLPDRLALPPAIVGHTVTATVLLHRPEGQHIVVDHFTDSPEIEVEKVDPKVGSAIAYNIRCKLARFGDYDRSVTFRVGGERLHSKELHLPVLLHGQGPLQE
jgi:hypothetical protein